MTRVVAIIVFCMLSMSAQASDGFSVVGGFGSIHLGLGSWNQDNSGIGVRVDRGEWAGWAAGVYYNSVRKNSAYLVREFQAETPIDGVRVGLLVGAVTGYRYAVMPAVIPELLVDIGRDIEAAAVLVPPIPGQTPAVIALQFRWKF